MVVEHFWPASSQHVWGKWMNKSRTVRYRTCVHPECDAYEEEDIPSA